MIDFSVFNEITTFVFDVDGVLTDSNILITEQGELLRNMNVRDGLAIKKALNQNYNIAIVTGGNSNGVKQRLVDLGISIYYDSVIDKMAVLNEIKASLNIDGNEILYMGDDLPDISVFGHVALACCPFDASNDVLLRAGYISPVRGGFGCVRDVIEKVMRIQGRWQI